MVSRHLVLVLLCSTTIMNLHCDGRKCEIYRNPIICCGRIKRKHLSFGRYFHLNMAGSFNNRDKESDIWTANPFKPWAAGCGWQGTVSSVSRDHGGWAEPPSAARGHWHLPARATTPATTRAPQFGHQCFRKYAIFGLHFVEYCYCGFPSEYNTYSERALDNCRFHMSDLMSVKIEDHQPATATALQPPANSGLLILPEICWQYSG